ncbi:hypothetical protein ACU4HD_27380 [Cupriavidus basilensis]
MMSTILREEIGIDLSGVVLPGDLVCPPRAAGLVLFAHGSGSSRLSPATAMSLAISTTPALPPC